MNPGSWRRAYDAFVGSLEPSEQVRLLGHGCWISVRHRLVYIDNPKAASTRLKQLMQKLDGRDEFAPPDSRGEQPGHYCARLGQFGPDLRAEILFSPAWHRFTFVRNPFVRLLSGFLNMRRVYATERSKGGARRKRHLYLFDVVVAENALSSRQDISFAQFVHTVTAQPDTLRDAHWRTQTRVLGADHVTFDFVGAVEAFADDFARVRERLTGEVPSLDLVARANTNVGYELSDYYDAKLAARVVEAYGGDFARFGYETDSWCAAGGQRRGVATGSSSVPHNVATSRSEPGGRFDALDLTGHARPTREHSGLRSTVARLRLARAACEQFPECAQSHARYAGILEELCAWREAAAAWAESLRVDPAQIHARCRLIVSVAEAEWPDGSDHLESAIAASPDAVRDDPEVAAIFLRATTHAGEPELALRRYQALPGDTRDAPEVVLEYGAALAAAGHPMRAMPLLKAASRRRPANQRILQLLVAVSASVDSKAHGEALALAVRSAPHTPGFATGLARWITASDAPWKYDAEVLVIVGAWPHEPLGWLALARTSYAQKLFGAAELAFACALRTGGEPLRATLGVAACARDRGEPEAAERYLRELQSAFPDSTKPYVRLAALARDAGESQKARALLDECQRRFGWGGDALHQHVALLLRERDFPAVRALIGASVSEVEVSISRRYCEAALAQAEGRPTRALQLFNALASEDAGYRDVRLRVVRCTLELGDTRAAAAALVAMAQAPQVRHSKDYLSLCMTVSSTLDKVSSSRFLSDLVATWMEDRLLLGAWLATLADAFHWSVAKHTLAIVRRHAVNPASRALLASEIGVVDGAAGLYAGMDAPQIRAVRSRAGAHPPGGVARAVVGAHAPAGEGDAAAPLLSRLDPLRALAFVQRLIARIALGEPFAMSDGQASKDLATPGEFERQEVPDLRDVVEWDLFDLLFAAVPRVSLVAWQEHANTILARHFGVCIRQWIRCPAPAHLPAKPVCTEPAELQIADAVGHLEVAYRGEVFLVAAHDHTSTFVEMVARQGGIAIDISGVMDVWTGFSRDRGGRTGVSEHARLAVFNRVLGARHELPWPLDSGGEVLEPPVFNWINLDGAHARAEAMRAMFAEHRLNSRRIEAIGGERACAMIRGAVPDGGYRPPELGNLVSHLHAMWYARKDSDDWFFVLEDDIELLGPVAWRAMLASAPADWEVLQLHTIRPGLTQSLYRRFARVGVFWTPWRPGFWSTAMYAIRAHAADRFLHQMAFDGNSVELDGVDSNIATDNVLYQSARTYTLTQPIAVTRDVASQVAAHPQARFASVAREVRKVQILAKFARTASPPSGTGVA